MPLSPGTRLGPYEVGVKIGEGGMGEVYQARDTRLDRTVAIKVLPENVASDADLKQRFEREARAVAALNHPHICTLHDIGTEAGTDYLVMEYLEGETLARRLEKGALPLDQALEVAIQIADALDKAHRQGITHRDLKPGNIMLTEAGAKLLDFGLAKLKPGHDAPVGVSAPTMSAGLTGEGAILGTLQYMAPEQLEGKDADARTDIFAFGAVVYEMATGKKAFAGENQASLIAAILEREPAPMNGLQPLSPPALDRVVTKSLAKDPNRRWQTASDLADELRWVTESDTSSTAVAESTAGSAAPGHTWPWMVAAVFAVATVVAVWSPWRPTDVSPPVTQASLGVQPAERLDSLNRTAMAISPDGRVLIYAGRRGDTVQLYRRDLDQPVAEPLAGTEGGASGPFFSPDGRWVGFHAAGEIRKVPIEGGPAFTITTGAPTFGASWGDDGWIVFWSGGRLYRVSEDGGEPERLSPELELNGRLAQVLPGGDTILFTARYGPVVGYEQAQIVAHSLATGETKIVLDNAVDARYVPTGHLVFARFATLMAVPFDLDALETTGGPVALLDGVAQSLNGFGTNADSGAAQFSVSDTGTLVYLAGSIVPDTLRSLTLVDTEGFVEPLPFGPESFGHLALSPDGRRLAVGTTGLEPRIRVYDLVRGGGGIALGQDMYAAEPSWTPDGSRVTFVSNTGDGLHLVWQVADGSQPPERLTTSPHPGHGGIWSPDGNHHAFVRDPHSIWVLSMEPEPTLRPFVETRFNQVHPAFSPDGRWLAYTSNETGRREVYVRPFPGGEGRHVISTDGGQAPTWSADGRQLFYLAGPRDGTRYDRVWAVDVTTEPTFVAGTPRPLVDTAAVWTSNPVRTVEVGPDGRFLTIRFEEDPPSPPRTHLNIVFNWFQELKERVPGP